MCWGSMVHKLVLRYKVTNWKSSLTNTRLLLESLSMGSTLYISHFQDPQHPGTLKPGGTMCSTNCSDFLCLELELDFESSKHISQVFYL